MHHYEYGIASTRPNKLKSSVIRPLSQQRSSSLSHQESVRKLIITKGDANRQSFRVSTSNEYYMEDSKIASRRPFRQFGQSNRSSSKLIIEGNDGNEKLRHFFIQKLQRCTMDLRAQIHKQSTLIFNLEKAIEQQNKQLQTKNNIIKTLISKVQQNPSVSYQRNENKQNTFLNKQIQDLSHRIRLLTEQIEQERDETSNKMEYLRVNLIKHFGKEVWKLKGALYQYLKYNDKKINLIENHLEAIYKEVPSKVEDIFKNITQWQQHIKTCLQDSFEKDNSSQTTRQSKDTQSLKSQKSQLNQPFKKEDSLCSDYFFHPAERQMLSLKTMEQLVKERQQLPIRVFLDVSGRLKYWESRTFIFDRKGNFTTPTTGEIAIMQQRGWIKVIASD